MATRTTIAVVRAGLVSLAVLGLLPPARAGAQAPQERPTSQVPTLGRPTKPDDPPPLLDFGLYFKGAWDFTWEYPDSPLGPADVTSGTTTYTQTGPSTFEAATEAENSGGKYTVKEVFEYRRDDHALSRTVTDSRGFTYTQQGTVNGDLGGQFTIRLDGAPFTYKGQTLRVNSVMRLLSPYNHRTQFTVSVGDGPFTNYGNPWWRKEVSR
ncbi:MAG: hypothetical protein R2745_00420 [Vicinamibacterales bacterium]